LAERYGTNAMVSGMSPGGFDSAGTGDSDGTGDSVDEPGLLGLAVTEAPGEPTIDVLAVGLDEHAASDAAPISVAAANMMIRRIVESSFLCWSSCVRRRR
jgi:hypothetical protein